MSPEQVQAFHSLSRAVRGLANAVANAAAELHEGGGMPTAMRAVLETVIVGGPKTVPAIARARGVSRQHVQALVDRLLAAALVAYRDNPAHRRSRLVAATESGKAALSALRERELAALSRLELAIGTDAMRQAREVVSDLAEAIGRHQWRAAVRNHPAKKNRPKSA